MSTVIRDKELEQYRSLMEVPSTFEDGFTWTALVGAVFIALLMVPGAMYMGLLAGSGIGGAAQWVTVILFLEVARRAHKTIKRPELFVLYYMAAAAMGSPFSGLLWNQFYVQSQAVTGMGLNDYMAQVKWFAPSDPDVLAQRNFFLPQWYPVIGMVLFSTIMERFNRSVLSYGLFRVASDMEKLPFPMAPIGAQGILALAEQQTEEGSTKSDVKEGWRWRVFSIGGVLGLTFGAIYTAVPAISSALFGAPVIILPIPFVDWTSKTADFLPAVGTGLTLDAGVFMVGMVLPFFAVLGSFLGMVLTMVANPILYKAGILKTWTTHDNNIIQTDYHNYLDFYFSFGIGVALAVALIGISQVFKSLRANAKANRAKREARLAGEKTRPLIPENRGDIKPAFILGVYLVTVVSYILLSGYLIDWHPGVMLVLVFFGFFYTPVMSYVTARLEGMAGQSVSIPMVKEASFLLSGYTGGLKIWFLPVPMADYGSGCVFYRQAELTGTRFWSIWKTEILLVPIVLVASILFAQFIWSLAPIPGPEYPYAQMMWEQTASMQTIVQTSTLGRFSQFQETFNGWYLMSGLGVGLVMFTVLWAFQMPVLLAYGVVRGLGQANMYMRVPEFLGAVFSKYYFERKMGLKWRQYVPVVVAGFSCGMGLITVLAVGLNFLSKAVIKVPF